MHLALKALANVMRRFRHNEDGSPTLEFVLLFLPCLMLPVSGVELGLLMTRHVMLERGIDMAVREVRLNTNRTVTEDELKQAINKTTAGYIMQSERPSNRLFSIGSRYLTHGDYVDLDQSLANVRAIDQAAVAGAAKQYLTSRAVEVTVKG